MKQILRNALRSRGYEIRRIVSRQQRHAEEYQKHLRQCWSFLQTYNPACVLDIGANEGQFAKMIREFLPETPIVSFEPLNACYQKLERLRTELAPFYPINTALGSTAETKTINRSESSPSSSFLQMGELHRNELPHTSASEAESVEVNILDDVIGKLPVKPPFLMKIDVQGFEEQVLLGATETLKQTVAVVVEISARPLYVGEPGFDRIYELMTGHGFDYSGNVDQWRSQKDGRILQFDCLFENRTLTDLPATDDVG